MSNRTWTMNHAPTVSNTAERDAKHYARIESDPVYRAKWQAIRAAKLAARKAKNERAARRKETK